MMSVLRTATQQGVDAIDYLARLARAPTPDAIPSLSPETEATPAIIQPKPDRRAPAIQVRPS